jgi:hypothetical protein
MCSWYVDSRCRKMINGEGAKASSRPQRPSPAILQRSQHRWIKTCTAHTNRTTYHISHLPERKKTSIYHDHPKRSSRAISIPNLSVRARPHHSSKSLDPFVVKGNLACILHCILFVSFLSSYYTGFEVSPTRGSKMVPARFPLTSGLRSPDHRL